MRLLKSCLFVSVFFYCGCSEAITAEKLPELACPYILPAKKDLPASWTTVGNIPVEKLQLRTIGVIDQDTSDIQNRNFSEDIIDEWDDFKDRSESVAVYDESHGNLMLKCVYARSYGKEASDYNINNVVLLIPLPSKKNVTCLLVNRKVDPELELSCKVK